LTAQFGTDFIRLTCSGTIAVELALRGTGVTAGDEVILAGYDFPGNFRAVEAVGATPVLVDVAVSGWTIDPAQLPLAESPAVKAVIVSHLHGQLAPIGEICRWAAERRIAVVEDACQVPGARIGGKTAGSWGTAAVLSFGGSKLLTAGRGGAVLTSSHEVAQRMTVFAERGNDAFPLSQLQAAALLPQLKQLDERNSIRRSRASQLQSLLAPHPAIELPPAAPAHHESAYYKFGFFVTAESSAKENRERVLAEAIRQGLAIGPGFRGFYRRSERRCRKIGSLTESRRSAEQTLLLHHPVLLESPETMERVALALGRAAAAR